MNGVQFVCYLLGKGVGFEVLGTISEMYLMHAQRFICTGNAYVLNVLKLDI